MNTSEGPIDCLPYIFTSFWRPLSTVLRDRRDVGSFFPAEGLLFLNLMWSPGASYLSSPLFCFPGGCGAHTHTHTLPHMHTFMHTHPHGHTCTHTHTHAPHTQSMLLTWSRWRNGWQEGSGWEERCFNDS